MCNVAVASDRSEIAQILAERRVNNPITMPITLGKEEWDADKKALSENIQKRQTHFSNQAMALTAPDIKNNPIINQLKHQTSDVFGAYKEFARKLELYKLAWDSTPYNIKQISNLLKFPYNERAALQDKILNTENAWLKTIYFDMFDFIQLLHLTAQQYIQWNRDQERAKLGYKTDEDEILGSLQNNLSALQQDLTGRIDNEKNKFWLPSHQKYASYYQERIRTLKRRLKAAKNTIASNTLALETTTSALNKNQTQHPITPSSIQNVEQIITDNKILTPAHVIEKLQRADIKEEDIELDSEEYKEYLTIMAKLEKQYQQDRVNKQVAKEARNQNATAKKPEDSIKSEPQEEKEPWKPSDDPTLWQIMALDVNLKTEEFFNFFKNNNFKFEEREGGITVWFNEELSKTFHRAHTPGNVVPYVDLRVTKRALKEIGAIPAKK